MPISRSTTVRHKSRSPAPPPTPTVSTPRSFLPPSYYAAAGGYTARNLSPRLPNIHTEHSSGHAKPSHNLTDDRTNLNGLASVLPPPGPSGSESSLAEVPAEAISLRRRQSTRSGFPDLEPQLLPSLRDTIDRMTRAPSKTSTFGIGKGNSELLKRETSSRSRRASPESWTTPETRQLSSRESPSLNHYRPANEDPRTPTISHNYSDQVTPTIGSTSSRLRTPGKSALKSALRSPTPKTLPNNTPVASNSPSMAGSSLRTMKSLLSRKYSGTLKSTLNDNKVHESSRHKDPRNTITGRRSSLSPSAVTPEIPSVTKGFKSSIPRPRTRHYQDDPHHAYSAEDSDFERRFEVENRDRRKLTVTNAEIFVSGSSSESDAESMFNSSLENRKDTRNPKNNGGSGATVGLGLLLPHRSPIRERWNERRSRDTSGSRQNVVTPSPQEKTLRFSLPASDSAGSSYSDDFSTSRPDSFGKSYNPGGYGPSRVRKRSDSMEAFMGPRSRESSPSQPRALDVDARRKEDSPYDRFPKSASGSPTSTQEVSTDEATESEREGYSFRRAKVKEKRRSSSCTPTFLPSSEQNDDGNNAVIPPPRSQSACQRYAEPSHRTSQAFPPNLRELIRSRNSFSRPITPRQESEPSMSTPSKRRSAQETKGKEKHHAKQAQASQPPPPGLRSRQEESYRRSSREQTEAAAIAEKYRSVAARERLAFGIPPSESDEAVRRAEQEQQLSPAESDMSSVKESIWQDECEELSLSAESLLRTLGGSSKKQLTQKSHQRLYQSTPRLSVISPTLSASSTYEDPVPEVAWHPADSHAIGSGWMAAEEESTPSTLSHSQEASKTREGVIQEIFETEEDLLRLLHICIRMFILPLRVQNSRSWVAGVPANVARLLDWFDDIVNLHEQIHQSLCSARDTMSPATDRVSESLRCFVWKVEVYQPYLVRLADVSQEIVILMDDAKSDFGQFITMQERSPECQGWSFERLLMLPVNRLAAYQDLFARMLDLTPKTHQDYLSTFSLSRSTDMVIKVMTEVKIREDEYMLLKAFSSRIQGLPASNSVATRERRLLHSGPLHLMVSNLSSVPGMGAHERTSEAKRLSRSSKLLDTIGKPNYGYERSNLMASASSSKTGDGSKTSTNDLSVRPKSSWFSRLPLRKRSRNKSPLPQELTRDDESTRSSPETAPRTVDVHAFVFNDLVLLAQSKQTSGAEPHWVLSDDLGIFRPLSIARIRRRNPQVAEGMVLSLEALALDAEYINDTCDFRTSSIRVVDLLIPRPPLPPGPSVSTEMDSSSNEAFQPWLLSLRQCCKATLRKLAFIGPKEGSFTGSDQTLDMHLALRSLVGSGLPIPRSPSGRLPDAHGLDDGPFKGDEREERGWWSLRYQQVFREFQRQDSLLSDDDDNDD